MFHTLDAVLCGIFDLSLYSLQNARSTPLCLGEPNFNYQVRRFGSGSVPERSSINGIAKYNLHAQNLLDIADVRMPLMVMHARLSTTTNLFNN